jgi:recombination protein RecA
VTRAADIETLRREINKMVGKEVINKGSDEKFQTSFMPTGVLPFDIMFGGGIPRNRYVELTGDYSTLKSYLALNAIREQQQAGGICAVIDTEHAFDPEWARQQGVKVEDLLLIWPDTGEEAVDAMELMIRNQVDLLVLDSIAATLPQAEANKRLSKESIQPGRLAALMSAAFRRLTAANSRTGLLLINQLREQIGVTFGPTEKAPGGRATGFYASMRVNCRKAGKVTRPVEISGFEKNITAKEMVGQTYRMTVEKSKLNRPWREMYFDFDLEREEIDIEKFLMLQCMDLGLLTRTGNTWHYEGTKVAIGSKQGILDYIHKNKDLQLVMEAKVREHHGLFFPPGQLNRPKTRAAVSRGKFSKSTEQSLRPALARGVSVTTAARKTKLSK